MSSRSCGAAFDFELAFAYRGRPEAGGTVKHDRHQRDAEDEEPDRFGVEYHSAEERVLQRLHRIAQHLGQQRQQYRAENDARNIAHAAQHHHRQHDDGFEQAEAFRAHELLRRRKDRAGDAAERRTHGERQQLYVAGIDAHRLGGNLVFADRFPRAAKARILQAEIDYDDADGDQQQEVVVLLRSGKRYAENDLGPRKGEAAEAKRIDQVDALRAVGDIERSIEVVQEDTDDLAETERYDREIVAAELQRGRAEQDAESAGDSRTQGENDPERKMNAEVR